MGLYTMTKIEKFRKIRDEHLNNPDLYWKLAEEFSLEKNRPGYMLNRAFLYEEFINWLNNPFALEMEELARDT